jgi:hypothetical protein
MLFSFDVMDELEVVSFIFRISSSWRMPYQSKKSYLVLKAP